MIDKLGALIAVDAEEGAEIDPAGGDIGGG
jgi:hypothetical protein